MLMVVGVAVPPGCDEAALSAEIIQQALPIVALVGGTARVDGEVYDDAAGVGVAACCVGSTSLAGEERQCGRGCWGRCWCWKGRCEGKEGEKDGGHGEEFHFEDFGGRVGSKRDWMVGYIFW